MLKRKKHEVKIKITSRGIEKKNERKKNKKEKRKQNREMGRM